MPTHRRTLLLGAAGAALRAPAADPISVGLIGAGGRGRYLQRVFRQDPDVRIAGVADVYEPNLEAGLSESGGARAYRNYRALLDNREIQAVIIATPEHWHHRMLLDALAAGKDVYVEKPLCQTPEQGVEMVDAARRSQSIVQVGMQRRSYDLFLKAREIVASGELGRVGMVRSWWLNNNLGSSTRRLAGPLDWEQWQGPAARRELDPRRFFHWRSYSEYSGGIMADQGAHVFDGIHMLLGAGYPLAVTATAGPILNSGFDTSERVVVTAEYPENFLAVFTINYAAMRYKLANDQLNSLDGDKARLDVGRESFALYRLGAEDTPAATGASKGFSYAAEAHVRNFLECVRTRRPANGTVEAGFQAALVTQMANISLRQQRRVRWNAARRMVEV
jgi:predicted dehydrogenase